MTETFLIGFTGFQIVVKDGQVKSVFFNILSLSKKPISDTTILGIRTKYIFNHHHPTSKINKHLEH